MNLWERFGSCTYYDNSHRQQLAKLPQTLTDTINGEFEHANHRMVEGITAQMLNRAEIIQAVAHAINAQTYLEIGVAHAETLLRIQVPNRIGVDPARPTPNLVNAAASALSTGLNAQGARFVLNIGVSDNETSLQIKNLNSLNDPLRYNLRYYQMTSDEFFEQQADESIRSTGIDIAFVDGLHEWRQVVRDVENCLGYLNDGGIVVMHDCSPTREIVATPFSELDNAKKLPEWDGTWTGDVYRAVLWLRSQRPDLDLCVLDCDWGVGLIRQQPANQTLRLTETQIANFSYEELDKNRGELLNLHDPAYLSEFTTQLSKIPPNGRINTLGTNRTVPLVAR